MIDPSKLVWPSRYSPRKRARSSHIEPEVQDVAVLEGGAPLHLHVADLHDRLDLGVVGNVAQELGRVRSKGLLEGIGAVEEQMPHGNEGRGRARRAARDTLLDAHALAGGA